MLEVFGERGGDPDRAGKKDPLDCVVWRGERPGEPSWDSPPGPAGPGWHIECTAIALEHLGPPSTCRPAAATWSSRTTRCAPARRRSPARHRFAKAYAHAGMVGLRRREDVEVEGQPGLRLRAAISEVDPMAIRLVLLRHHYRSDWEWTDDPLWDAVDTLESWRKALSLGAGAPAGRSSRRCSPRWPTTWTPRPPSRPSRCGPTRPSA